MNKIIIILGPTASGKTNLSINLAKKFNGEIVSTDSRQIYKEMDIGTAKPTKKEQTAVPHHLIDIIALNKTFSVARYQKLAYKAIDDILKQGKTPFLVGGTAFYIYSMVEGWQFPKMEKDALLQQKLENKPLSDLVAMLKKLDKTRAQTIDLKNKRRVIRAIEIAKTLGKVPKIKKQPKYDCLLLGLKTNNEELKKRIKQRVDLMVKQGLEKEVKTLINKYGETAVLRETIGYAEWIEKGLEKNYVPLKIAQNTINFSKKQMTWFKRDKNIHWIKNNKEAEKIIASFISI